MDAETGEGSPFVTAGSGSDAGSMGAGAGGALGLDSATSSATSSFEQTVVGSSDVLPDSEIRAGGLEGGRAAAAAAAGPAGSDSKDSVISGGSLSGREGLDKVAAAWTDGVEGSAGVAGEGGAGLTVTQTSGCSWAGRKGGPASMRRGDAETEARGSLPGSVGRCERDAVVNS